MRGEGDGGSLHKQESAKSPRSLTSGGTQIVIPLDAPPAPLVGAWLRSLRRRSVGRRKGLPPRRAHVAHGSPALFPSAIRLHPTSRQKSESASFKAAVKGTATTTVNLVGGSIGANAKAYSPLSTQSAKPGVEPRRCSKVLRTTFELDRSCPTHFSGSGHRAVTTPALSISATMVRSGRGGSFNMRDRTLVR
jgi:hypothetical protein